MISLSDLSDSQYRAITGRRRRINLGDIVRYQLPAHIEAGRNKALEELERARQREQRRQFEEGMALQEEIADEQKKQGYMSSGLSAATAIGQGGYAAKRLGWLGSGDKGVSGIKELASWGNLGGTTGAKETAAALAYEAPPASLSEATTLEAIPGLTTPTGTESLAAISAGTAGPTVAIPGAVEGGSLAAASAAGEAGAGASAGLGPVQAAGPGLGGYLAGPAVGIGVGYGVGRMTQSRTKGAVSGGLSGAAVGFATGGPVGAVIGAVTGVVSGLVGGNK